MQETMTQNGVARFLVPWRQLYRIREGHAAPTELCPCSMRMLLSFWPRICINLHLCRPNWKTVAGFLDLWHFKAECINYADTRGGVRFCLTYDLLDAWLQLNHWRICCLSASLSGYPNALYPPSDFECLATSTHSIPARCRRDINKLLLQFFPLRSGWG